MYVIIVIAVNMLCNFWLRTVTIICHYVDFVLLIGAD